MRGFVAIGVAALTIASAGSAAAQDRDPEAAPVVTLRTAIKGSVLVDPRESIGRIRFEAAIKPVPNAAFTVAYEQRVHYASTAGGIATIGILPSQAASPFRIRPLDWTLGESSSTTWRHEIDRANAEFRVGRADITVGRQAIGWGRGVMFGAVDLFAPFSPIEADREWRRGVDAVHADIKLTDRSSVDVIGALGNAKDTSAFAGRIRGYTGALDVEVMAGRRARDVFGGAAMSAPVGDAELHGELAVFRADAGAGRDADRIVWKAVAGGSYRFPLGSGLLAYAEYHYSGFGATRPEAILPLLQTPAFAERYVRGDTQILSRHAVAMSAMYEVSPEISYAGQWLHNPRDGSGIVAPGLTYTFSDALSVLATAYVSYGKPARGGLLQSEFGAAPVSALLQVRLYL